MQIYGSLSIDRELDCVKIASDDTNSKYTLLFFKQTDWSKKKNAIGTINVPIFLLVWPEFSYSTKTYFCLNVHI